MLSFFQSKLGNVLGTIVGYIPNLIVSPILLVISALFQRWFWLDLTWGNADAMEALMCYSWPGNVRELRHVLEAAIPALTTDQLEPQHLPLKMSAENQRSSKGSLKAEMEALEADRP